MHGVHQNGCWRPQRITRFQQGFTLLELSIVLVIIGLIIGGVTAGQSLISNARLNSVLSDTEKFQTAVYAFSQKYGALPGDISNAKSYWPDGSQYAGFTTGNGNGDGRIGSTSATAAENNDAWQQMGVAGLVPGSYDGATSPVIGSSIPASKLPSAGYWLGHTVYEPPTIINLQDGYSGHHLQLSQPYMGNMGGSVIAPADAKAIDLKGDDGKPHTGRIQGEEGGPNFTNCKDGAGTEYALTISDPECVLNILMR